MMRRRRVLKGSRVLGLELLEVGWERNQKAWMIGLRALGLYLELRGERNELRRFGGERGVTNGGEEVEAEIGAETIIEDGEVGAEMGIGTTIEDEEGGTTEATREIDEILLLSDTEGAIRDLDRGAMADGETKIILHGELATAAEVARHADAIVEEITTGWSGTTAGAEIQNSKIPSPSLLNNHAAYRRH
jgi:hypothetical protein